MHKFHWHHIQYYYIISLDGFLFMIYSLSLIFQFFFTILYFKIHPRRSNSPYIHYFALSPTHIFYSLLFFLLPIPLPSSLHFPLLTVIFSIMRLCLYSPSSLLSLSLYHCYMVISFPLHQWFSTGNSFALNDIWWCLVILLVVTTRRGVLLESNV